MLVVTNRRALGARVGDEFTQRMLQDLQDHGNVVVDDLPKQFDSAAIRRCVVPHLQRQTCRGVLILGGYDVVPAARIDCLPDDLRKRIDVTTDPDQFVVWSDGPYGDVEGDEAQELPVSRLPDLASPAFLRTALERPVAAGASGVHGVRNVHRPFADAMVASVRPLLQSVPVIAETLGPGDFAAPNLYFMLHGDDGDGGCYWGESEDAYPEAVRTAQLPARIDGVVFAGCCWGALIVRESARRLPAGELPTARPPASSLALTCLDRGAHSFVGCTGAHYSPPQAPYDYLGGPLHRGFWEGLLAGKSPARALYDARIEFFRGLPHRPPGQPMDNLLIAMELKLFEQFTCLGRGF